MKCAVCGNPGRQWKGVKRTLCQKCYDAAIKRSNYLQHFPQAGRFDGHLPADRGIDTYEGRSRYTME